MANNKQIRVLILTTSDVVIDATVDNTLDTFQALVSKYGKEAYIEGIRVPTRQMMGYVNEDGRMQRMRPNRLATILFGQAIVGDVVIVRLVPSGASRFDPLTEGSMTDADVAYIKGILHK